MNSEEIKSVEGNDDEPLPLFFRCILPSVAWVLFMATLPILFTKGNTFLGDPATPRHLASGRLMWERHEIITKDPFSYTLPEGRWVRFEWLSEGVAWYLTQVGGLKLFTLCSMFAFAMIPFLMWRFLIHQKITAPVAFFYTLTAIIILHAHLLARPFLFTYLFTLIVMHFWALDLEKPRKAFQWVLPFLFMLWCNLHAGFVGGLIFLFASWMGAALDRRSREEVLFTEGSRLWLRTILLCFLVTIVNPYGIGLLVRIFETIFTIKSVGLLEESAGLDFAGSLPLAIGFFIVILTLILNRTGEKIRWAELLPVLLFLYFGFKTRRHVFILMMFAALPVCRIWQRALESWWKEKTVQKWKDFTQMQRELCSDFLWLGATCVVTFGLFWVSEMGTKLELGAETLPKEVRSFIHDHIDRFQKPIHHTGNAGPLMYYFYPQIKVIIDDRIDFYGDAWTQKYLDLYQIRKGWQERLSNEGYDSAII
ncbi:MAG: hypothetical protein V4507_13305, partial [Verrucomicrobiota bacterium]